MWLHIVEQARGMYVAIWGHWYICRPQHADNRDIFDMAPGICRSIFIAPEPFRQRK